MTHWPAFDADLTLLDSGNLLVSGPLGGLTSAPTEVVVFGVVTQPPSQEAPQGTWVRGEVKLVPGISDASRGKLPLEYGMWHFVGRPSPGKLVPGPALAHALRVEMTESGSIATQGWSQWLSIDVDRSGVEDAEADLLAQPLSVASGFPDRFADVQPNILRGHARDELDVRLLRFDDVAAVRQTLRELAGEMKTAKAHEAEVAQFHDDKIPTNAPYIGIGLSRSGYQKLGKEPPGDPAFAAGMRARRDLLGDPDDGALEAAYGVEADAILMVAWPRTCAPAQRLSDVVSRFAPGTTELAAERGGTLFSAPGSEPVEHFGFADGISAPRFVVGSGSRKVDTTPWNPIARLTDVLVREPGGEGFGSYLVYRKLRQDPAAFQASTQQVAKHLWNDADRADHAGALLFGRHADGTPVVQSSAPSGAHPPTNAFDYDADPNGLRCPMGAHIRRMEERNGTSPVLARRGQTYGSAGDGEVGVLFMAVMASIERQFEAIQRRANDPATFDPVIGQANGERPASELTAEWGQGATTAVATAPAVDLRGGGYFFLPSIAFLKAL
jgi:deferrochelatase/peroxidase EfeB